MNYIIKIDTMQYFLENYEWALADYFDVSLDYLCGRTDKPQGKLYEYEPKALKIKEENKADMEQFIDMCFDPSSPAGVKMKEAMMKLLIEKEDKWPE